MKVEYLELTNFRGIDRLRLHFQERTNVLVGVNGSGKSAILDCATVLLSRLIARIRTISGKGRSILVSDISSGHAEARGEISVAYREKSYQWSVARVRRGRTRRMGSNLGGLGELAGLLRSDLGEHGVANLPLAVSYPVNRSVLDIPLRIRKKHPFDQLSAYDQALDGGSSNFRVFFEWFREREDLENENRIGESSYRDPQLSAVRNAISRFMPGFAGLRVRRSPLRMVARKDDRELSVNQLSDGEKCTLAMVGDLARRLAMANPSLANPLRGAGVVLIDEIDLHLHPGWQRHIIDALPDTFPSCQFLLSTHSPEILGHVKARNVWMLERTGAGLTASHPEDSYGREVSMILESIMKTSARPRVVEEHLSSLFRMIEQGDVHEAGRRLDEMRTMIGEDPDLVKAEMLIRRKEVLGR
ncbi:MAG: AAA family ATPase [Rhodospirillales bacterium]|nr:AAA family ATPase [Rhodospirillales bacterium]